MSGSIGTINRSERVDQRDTHTWKFTMRYPCLLQGTRLPYCVECARTGSCASQRLPSIEDRQFTARKVDLPRVVWGTFSCLKMTVYQAGIFFTLCQKCSSFTVSISRQFFLNPILCSFINNKKRIVYKPGKRYILSKLSLWHGEGGGGGWFLQVCLNCHLCYFEDQNI